MPEHGIDARLFQQHQIGAFRLCDQTHVTKNLGLLTTQAQTLFVIFVTVFVFLRVSNESVIAQLHGSPWKNCL